jgi:hypothetical protein
MRSLKAWKSLLFLACCTTSCTTTGGPSDRVFHGTCLLVVRRRAIGGFPGSDLIVHRGRAHAAREISDGFAVHGQRHAVVRRPGRLRRTTSTGLIRIEDSIIRNNTGGSWYVLPGISMHEGTHREIINSTIE